MMNFFSTAIARVGAFLNGLQVKRLVMVLCVGLLVLTTNTQPPTGNKALTDKIDRTLNQDQTQRPKTTGEFLDEARGDVPLGERVENITRDSVEAFKKLGAEYGEAAQDSARTIRDGVVDAAKQASK
jgi:hypothetical protein